MYRLVPLRINQKHAPASLQSTFNSLYLLLSQQKENIFEQEYSCNCQKGGVQHDEGKATKTADDTCKPQSRDKLQMHCSSSRQAHTFKIEKPLV